jgi:hypothetical protein
MFTSRMSGRIYTNPGRAQQQSAAAKTEANPGLARPFAFRMKAHKRLVGVSPWGGKSDLGRVTATMEARR